MNSMTTCFISCVIIFSINFRTITLNYAIAYFLFNVKFWINSLVISRSNYFVQTTWKLTTYWKAERRLNELHLITKSCNHFPHHCCLHTFTFLLPAYSFFNPIFPQRISPQLPQNDALEWALWENPSVRPDYQSELGAPEEISILILRKYVASYIL